MRMRNDLIGLFLVALLPVAGAHGQTLYRCGSSYQDRPCDSADNQRVVGHGQNASADAAAGSPASGGASVSAAAQGQCRQRGVAAEKIMWAREAGQTLPQQLADTARPVNPDLANDVYQRHGSAAEVRRAVEQDCLADAQQAAEAARLNSLAADILARQAGSKNKDGSTAPGSSTITIDTSVGASNKAPAHP
jgi:hypothetical protein